MTTFGFDEAVSFLSFAESFNGSNKLEELDMDSVFSTSETLWDIVAKNRIATAAVSFGTVFCFEFVKEKVGSILKENEMLKRENQVLREENDLLKTAVASLQQTTNQMNSRIEMLENRLDKLGQLCIICQEEVLNASLVPCGHSFCKGCATKLRKCPLCSVTIEKRIARY